MKPELKPCPFCGGKAQLIEQWIQDPLGRPRIDCSVCRVGFDYIPSQKTLIKLWNSRHNEESPRERFRREYRDARMVGSATPVVSSNPVIFHQNWLDMIKNQCTPAAFYAISSADNMDCGLSLEARLTFHKLRKRGFSAWK